jgi:hypothetical protein
MGEEKLPEVAGCQWRTTPDEMREPERPQGLFETLERPAVTGLSKNRANNIRTKKYAERDAQEERSRKLTMGFLRRRFVNCKK